MLSGWLKEREVIWDVLIVDVCTSKKWQLSQVLQCSIVAVKIHPQISTGRQWIELGRLQDQSQTQTFHLSLFDTLSVVEAV